MRRVLVTGSRDFHYWEDIHEALDEERAKGEFMLVHGDCPTGADYWADRWATMNAVVTEKHPADWAKHGKAAGPIRNQEMVDRGADICLVFILAGAGRSRGTRDCMGRAEKAGITLKVRSRT